MICVVEPGQTKQQAWDEFRQWWLDAWHRRPVAVDARILRMYRSKRPPRSIVFLKRMRAEKGKKP